MSVLGLIVGEFYPPHRGHKHLIDSARLQCDHLIVLLAHHPSQTIPGELRKAWLTEIHPDCDIRLVPDEHKDDTQQWAEFVTDYLLQTFGRSPDVVFSSDDSGPGFAAFMNCRHVMIDRLHNTVPITGPEIRQRPLANLDFLEPCVRAHFVKRVVLIGAESTGKTTLARQLAEHFQTAWVPEYAREHWERKIENLSADSPPPAWTPEEFVHIAAEQQHRESIAARSANKVLICDTNAFATGTWFERYHHAWDARDVRDARDTRDARDARDTRVDAIGQRDIAHLYLLTKPDVPFVQDGVRDGEAIRNWMHERFATLLSTTGVPWVLIEGDFAQRLFTSIAAIERLMDASS